MPGGRAYAVGDRSRDHTTVHTVADDLEQARDDIAYHWSESQVQDWVTLTLTLTHEPGLDPTTQPAPAVPTPAREPVPVTPLTKRERPGT